MLADWLRSSLSSPEDTLAKFVLAKNTMRNVPALLEQTNSRIMEVVAGPLAQSCPNLAKIAAIGLLIPASPVDCERGLSALKRIKTDKRNSISNTNLISLLLISTEGPATLEFPCDEAVEKWAAAKNRWLNV